MMTIEQNLTAIQKRIQDAAQKAQRDANSVTLLAVSKAQKINHIRQAFAAGQKMFGENYLSESIAKIEALNDLPIEWHFIGPIQSNKTRDIARHFGWVHSVDRMKIARRLAEQRPAQLPALNVCVQLNLFAENTKQGIDEDHLSELLALIQAEPRLNLRGLMAIPPPAQHDPNQQADQFARIHSVFERAQREYPSMDTLSMGMSADLEAAVAQGSTLVRVGTALFGERPAYWKKNGK